MTCCEELNRKGSEILTKVIKLAYHNFTNTDRRHWNPGLETQEFVTAIAVVRDYICTSPLIPHSHKATQREPGNSCTFSDLCYSRETLDLWNPNLL